MMTAASVLVAAMPAAAQTAGKERFYARERLHRDGSAVAPSVTDPNPKPEPPADPTDDNMADYVRRTGAYVKGLVAASSGTRMDSLAEVGSPTFDYKSRATSYAMAAVGARLTRVYQVKVDYRLCDAIRRRMGMTPMSADLVPEIENCGSVYGAPTYVMPVDDVLRPKQVANVLATVRILKNAALASSDLEPSTPADVGSPATPIGNLTTGILFDRPDRTGVYVRMNGFDMGLCDHMRRQAGMRPWTEVTTVSSTVPQDCGFWPSGNSGNIFRSDISGELGAAQVAKLREAAAIIRQAISDTGSTAPKVAADIGSPALGLGRLQAGDPVFAGNRENGFWLAKIPLGSQSTCNAVRRAIGEKSLDDRFSVNPALREDCGYDIGTGKQTYTFSVGDVTDGVLKVQGGEMSKDADAVADRDKDANPGPPVAPTPKRYFMSHQLNTPIVMKQDGYYTLAYPFATQDSYVAATCLAWERINGRSLSGSFSYGLGALACHYYPYIGNYAFYRVVGRY